MNNSPQSMVVNSKSISADIKTDRVPIDQHLLANTDTGLRLALCPSRKGQKTAVQTSLETRWTHKR